MFLTVEAYPERLVAGRRARGAIQIDPDGFAHLFFKIDGCLFVEIKVFLFDTALCNLSPNQLLIRLLFFLVLHRLLPARVDHDDVFAAKLTFLIDGRPFLIQLNHTLRVVKRVRMFNNFLGISFRVICWVVSLAGGRGDVVLVGGVEKAIL